MISFDLSIKDIEAFELEKGVNQQIVNLALALENLTYKLICNSPRNSYQKESTLDTNIRNYLQSFGNGIINPKIDHCPINITYDFALRIGNSNVVFEIEKANKEKILYDFLKAHIYLDSNIDKFVIIAPKNWMHSLGYYDLFKTAKERLQLCYKYRMGDKMKLKNILVIGFNQYFKNQIHDAKSLEIINQQCREHFSSLR